MLGALEMHGKSHGQSVLPPPVLSTKILRRMCKSSRSDNSAFVGEYFFISVSFLSLSLFPQTWWLEFGLEYKGS